MEKVKFYLEKRRNKVTGRIISENVPIFLFYSFKGQRLQYFTGCRIDAFKWDEPNMKPRKGLKDVAEINEELDRLKVRIKEIVNEAKVLGDNLTVSYIRDRLKESDIKTKKRGRSFNECYNEYIESSKITKAESTMTSIQCNFKIVYEFSKKTGYSIEFDTITQEFYDKFLQYCFTKKEFKNNYVGKIIKDIKAFMNWATERGYNKNMDFKKKAFKKLTEDPEIIFLTYDELMKLYDHDFEGNLSLEQVKDVFCFGCFTGMRFSDIEALERENIHKDFINYRIVKTDQINTIPLNKYSKAILKKYQKLEKPLPVISEQKTNLYLKTVCEKAGLKRKVQKISFQGAKRIKTTGLLHELITFHISKKTFMTNFLAKGGSLLTAMAITGNKDLKTARRYYKVVDSLKADEMAKVFGK